MPTNFRAVRVKVFGSVSAQIYVSEMTSALTRISGRLVNSWKARMRRDTGQEQRNLRAKVTGSVKKLLLQVYATTWQAWIDEYGRKAGATMAPFSEGKLLRWVARRGLGAAAFSTATRKPIAAGTPLSLNRKTGQMRSRKQSLQARYRSIAFLIARKQADSGQLGSYPATRTLAVERNFIISEITLARDKTVQRINSGTP